MYEEKIVNESLSQFVEKLNTNCIVDDYVGLYINFLKKSTRKYLYNNSYVNYILKAINKRSVNLIIDNSKNIKVKLMNYYENNSHISLFIDRMNYEFNKTIYSIQYESEIKSESIISNSSIKINNFKFN